MPRSVVNGIELAWKRHGREDCPAICLIHGLGMSLSAWPSGLIGGLVNRGFGVITLDNRDIGHSQLMTRLGKPNLAYNGLMHTLGFPLRPPYSLADMMDDTAALLRSLGIFRTHMVGVSMGGMIAQLLAIHEPGLVASLTSIMSTTGRRNLPGPAPEVARHLISRPASRSREDRVRYNLKTWALIGSPAYPRSSADLKEFVERNLDRRITADGIARQTLAILAAPSRVAQLQKLNVPSLIIHGDADPLVPVECGVDTARSIPGSRLHVIPGMGHDLPPQLTDHFVALIAEHAAATMKI